MPVLFCQVRHRSLLFFPVEVEMAEECLRLKTEPNKVSTLFNWQDISVQNS